MTPLFLSPVRVRILSIDKIRFRFFWITVTASSQKRKQCIQRLMGSPGPGVTVGAELAAEDGLPDIFVPLYLEHDRAAFRLSSELEHEPGLRFGPDHHVDPGARLAPSLYVKLHPSALEHDGPRVGPVQPHADLDPPYQLRGGDPACAASAASVDRKAEDEGPAGEAAERGRVEVETGSGGGGVRQGLVVAGGEW